MCPKAFIFLPDDPAGHLFDGSFIFFRSPAFQSYIHNGGELQHPAAAPADEPIRFVRWYHSGAPGQIGQLAAARAIVDPRPAAGMVIRASGIPWDRSACAGNSGLYGYAADLIGRLFDPPESVRAKILGNIVRQPVRAGTKASRAKRKQFKTRAFESILAEHGCSASECAYMGDDVPDIPVLDMAGLSAAPADADPAIAAMVDWVAPKNGGSGAVRSLAEFILHAQGKWDALVKARYVQGKI